MDGGEIVGLSIQVTIAETSVLANPEVLMMKNLVSSDILLVCTRRAL